MKKQNQIKDDKLKPLSPPLRIKKRFVKFEIISKKKFSFREVSENIMAECISLLGAIDIGKSGLWLLRDKFVEDKQIGVLKVSTTLKEKTLGALALIKTFDKTPVRVKILSVSGTLKGLEK